jgi:hypothetical protein
MSLSVIEANPAFSVLRGAQLVFVHMSSSGLRSKLLAR